MTNIPLTVTNKSGKHLVCVARCSIPYETAKGNGTTTYVVDTPHGQYGAVLGAPHGDHHVELTIVTQNNEGQPMPPGKFQALAVPVAGATQVPPFAVHPNITKEPLAIVPRAKHAGRPIKWDAPTSADNGAEKIITWQGRTEDSPQFNVIVEMRVGHNSPMCPIEVFHIYSDRTIGDWNADGLFEIEFDEPVSWFKRPQVDEHRSEQGCIGRGVMMWTAREGADEIANEFVSDWVYCLADPSVWQGHFMIWGNVMRGQPGWSVPDFFAQFDKTGGTGNHPAHGVQDGNEIMHDVDLLAKLRFDQDRVEPNRGNLYMEPDGKFLYETIKEPRNHQYHERFYNSVLDYRFNRHDNWGQPKDTWEPSTEFAGADWGHINLGYQCADFVFNMSTQRERELRAECMSIIYRLPYGSRNDRYTGRPLTALAMCHRLFPDLRKDIEDHIETELQRQWDDVLFRSGGDLNWKIFCGEFGQQYGGYLSNPKNPTEGGWAPWQAALWVKGIMDVFKQMPTRFDRKYLDVATKVAQAVVLEGFQVTPDGKYKPFYVAGHNGGEWVNKNNDALARGWSADSSSQPNSGYFFICAPCYWLVTNFGFDDDAKTRAADMRAKLPLSTYRWEHVAWCTMYEEMSYKVPA